MRLCCNLYRLSLAALTLRLVHVHSAADLGWQTAPFMLAGRQRLPVQSAMIFHKLWLMLPNGAEEREKGEKLYTFSSHLGLIRQLASIIVHIEAFRINMATPRISFCHMN